MCSFGILWIYDISISYMCDSVCSFPSWLCFKYEWSCHSKETMGSTDQYSTIKFQGGGGLEQNLKN